MIWDGSWAAARERVQRTPVLATALVVAALASVWAVPVVRPLVEAATRTEISTVDDTMPVDLAPVAAAAMAPAAFHLSATAEGFQATNPAQDLELTFSTDGPQVVPAGSEAALGLELARIGRSGDLRAPEAAHLEADGARLDYVRGDVTEWYVNDGRGLEQGFTLDASPAGDAGRPLVVELAPSGPFAPTFDAASDSIRFVGDGTTLTYSGLHAYDADARPLPSHLGLVDGTVTLTVDDRGAAYPVTIDPIIAEQQQILESPTPNAGDRFGSAVAVWGDWAVVGAPLDDAAGTDAGAAYVFHDEVSGWEWRGRLIGSLTGAADRFGSSVAISGPSSSSADTVVVGAPGDTSNDGAGEAYVFFRTGPTTWVQQAHLTDPSPSTGDQFGASVGLSGNNLVVGAPLDSTGPSLAAAGSASTFRRTGTAWAFEAHLEASEAATEDNFGQAVAMSGDTAVVGAPDFTPGPSTSGPGNHAGSVSVFVRSSGGAWSTQADHLTTGLTEAFSGTSVAIDGDVLAVGAPGNPSASGHAFIWRRTGTTWALESDPSLFGIQDPGESIGLSGEVAVVGDPFRNAGGGLGAEEAGEVKVVTRLGSTWAQRTSLIPPIGVEAPGDRFGTAVAIAGETTIAGVPFDDTAAGADAGSAYVFRVAQPAATVTVEQAADQADPFNAAGSNQDIDYDVVFSQAVSGFDEDDVIVGGTAGGDFFVEVIPKSARIYDVRVSGMTSDGTVTVQIAAGAATDADGVPTASSTSIDNSVTFDGARPLATLGRAPGQNTPSSADPVRFRAIFSEPVNGFAGNDVSLVLSDSPGDLTATVTPATPGDRQIFDIAVTGMVQEGDIVALINTNAVTDDAGNTNGASGEVLVHWFPPETPPTVDAGSDDSVAEGDEATLDGTVTDAQGGVTTTWTMEGTSLPNDPGTTCTIADPHAVDTTVTCDDDVVILQMRLTADDGVFPPVSDTVQISFENRAPEVGAVTASPGPHAINTPLSVSAAFTDPGQNDTHTCTIDWDDGNEPVPATVSAGTCTGSHTYTVAGIYFPTVRVTDDDGASDQDFGEQIAPGFNQQTIDFPHPGPKQADDPPFTLTATASSGLPVAYAVPPGGPCTVSGAVVTITGGGLCAITATQPGNDTYAAAVPAQQLVFIATLSQEITFGPIEARFVDDAPFTVSATASSGLPVSFSSPPGSPCTVSGATVTILGAGSCTIRADQAGNGQYAPAPTASQALMILKRPQSIEFTPVGPRFAGEVFTVSASASSGLPVTFSILSGPCSIDDATVTATTDGVCAISASQAGDATYEANQVQQNVTIAPRADQNINLVVPASKTLGDAPFTVLAEASSGLPVTLTVPVGAPCAVEDLTVTLLSSGTCVVTATQDGNVEYLPAPPKTGTITIVKKPQTIDFPDPGPHFIGDVFEVSATATSDLPVTLTALGQCTVSGTTVTITAAGICALLANQPGDATWAAAPQVVYQNRTPSQAPQTIDFPVPGPRPYGDAPFTVSATATSGLPVSFSVPADGPCTIADATVTITASGTCSITASQAGSASVLAAPPVTRDVTIAKATLTVTASDGAMTYGGTAPTITASLDGFVNGEDESVLTTDPTCGGGSPTTPAGTHLAATSCSGAAAANYSFDYVGGTLAVAKAPLTVTASDETVVYGASVAVTASYDGFVNDDEASDLDTAPTCGHTPSLPVGLHPGATSCAGAADANYEIVPVAGTVTVTKAPLTISASDGVMTYGGPPPVITPDYDGFVNDEDASVLTAAPTCAGGSPTTPAGGHAGGTACSGAEAANYEIGYVDGDLTVAKAVLTISASDGSMTYGGPPPTITASYDGFVNDDDASDLDTAPTCSGGLPTTPAGAHVDATSCSGAEAANYSFSYVDGDLTVAKAVLTISASDGSMTYGDAPPTITASYDGFVNDDEASDLDTAPTCSGGLPTTPAGPHADATSCSGAEAANYDIGYVNGDLTVEKAPLTITASDGTMTYGGPPPTITASYDGFVNGEDESVLTTAPTCAGGSPTTPAGAHVDATSCSGAAAANYEIGYVDGDLTVAKAQLVVTADAKSTPYGQPVPALTYTATGFVNGEDASVLSGAPALSTTATVNSGVGTYPITISAGSLTAANYHPSFSNGVLTVVRAASNLAVSPALISLSPLALTLGTASARLTYSTPARPLAGQTVVFTAGSTPLCTATTNANGVASCRLSLLGTLAAVANLGYTASFAGSDDIAAGTGRGPLVG